MARPLKKTKPDGTPYSRSPEMEAQIDEVVRLSLTDLGTRLLITDREANGYLSHECLVHLVRRGRQSNDQDLMYVVLPVLLGRCEGTLLAKVRDDEIADAQSLRQEILDRLTELFALDGSADRTDELDFYECRFNRAFRTLRIDAVRRELRRRRSFSVIDLSRSEATSEPDAYDDALAKMSDAFRVLPTQEWDARRGPLVAAIAALPPDERKAVILVHVLGYKEESEDPNEETAATRCNCTGRTIRNRLTRAAAKLSRFKEEI
jgi:hypothetical protein